MKKLFFCLTIFMILFFLISCGGSKTTDDTDSGEIQNDEDSVDTDPTDTDIPDNTDDEPAEEADQDETDTEFSEEGGLCPNPCEEIANSTGVCILKDVQYICECYADYEWNGFSCVRSVPLTLGNICTGQTACYDMSSSMKCPSSPEADFYGQDWQYAELGYCTLQSFTDLPDVIVDNNTGLIWEKSPSSGTYIWEETQNHCDDLNKEVFAGIDSWRVPNPLELLTIVDNSTSQQATNSNFKRMAELWTSKSYEGESGTSAYYFSSFFGSVSSKNKTERLKVLCVSGDEMQAAQESDFEISEDEMTVTDKRTGLVWEKNYHTDMDWKAMLAYCQSLNTGTETGWRLPNKNEVASLLDHDKSIPYSNFPGMSYDYCLWSSTTFVYMTSDAWEICRGHVASYHKNFEKNEFRCVK